MLEVAHVTSSDVVYDLGCGDGRIVVTAAKIGAKAIGFDLDPVRVSEARANVTAGGVGALASIRRADVFAVDLQPATVVTLYLLPELNVQLIPQLEKLRAQTQPCGPHSWPQRDNARQPVFPEYRRWTLDDHGARVRDQRRVQRIQRRHRP